MATNAQLVGKALRIIDSCTTKEQLAVAKRWYELAIKKLAPHTSIFPDDIYADMDRYGWLCAFDQYWNTKADELSKRRVPPLISSN